MASAAGAPARRGGLEDDGLHDQALFSLLDDEA
jgi:hypothetical protein